MPAERRVFAPTGRKLDTRPDLRVARLASEHWGVLSTDELRACGLSYKAVEGRVANGQLHRLHRGVYAVGHPNVRRHAGIRTHRSSMLEVQDVTRHKGIPTTTPARTLVDLAATLDYGPLRRAT